MLGKFCIIKTLCSFFYFFIYVLLALLRNNLVGMLRINERYSMRITMGDRMPIYAALKELINNFRLCENACERLKFD